MAFGNPEQIIAQVPIQPSSTVADFGAGSGHYTIPVARIVGSGGVVYAVDVQKEILSRLAHTAERDYRLNNIEIVWGDIDEDGGSELRDGIADVVIMANVLFLLDDIPAAAREAYRVLKTGGRVLLVEWSDSFNNLGPEASCIVPEARARDVFTAAGFSCTTAIDAGAHHYGFICNKT